MKYYSTLDEYRMRDRKKIRKQISGLDTAILSRAGKSGADFYEIWNACRPYKGRTGLKLYAPASKVRSAIQQLRKKGLLEIG